MRSAEDPTTGPDSTNSVDQGRKRRSRPTPLWITVFLIGTVSLAAIGFLFKFIEFVAAYLKTDGTDFSIIPVATYLAVAAGYLCFFVWAFRQGMFTDIEAPKYRMLEMQDEIDAQIAAQKTNTPAQGSHS